MRGQGAKSNRSTHIGWGIIASCQQSAKGIIDLAQPIAVYASRLYCGINVHALAFVCISKQRRRFACRNYT
jgi:hypothetical protein